jgi:hypothetical protein
MRLESARSWGGCTQLGALFGAAVGRSRAARRSCCGVRLGLWASISCLKINVGARRPRRREVSQHGSILERVRRHGLRSAGLDHAERTACQRSAQRRLESHLRSEAAATLGGRSHAQEPQLAAWTGAGESRKTDCCRSHLRFRMQQQPQHHAAPRRHDELAAAPLLRSTQHHPRSSRVSASRQSPSRTEPRRHSVR